MTKNGFCRAKLKSDEELGRSAGLRSCSRKDRRGSGSSSSDGGDRAKAGKTVVKIGGSPVRKTGVNGKDCAIMDMGDGRTCVAVDGERRAPIALDDEEYDRIGRSQTPSMRSATPVSTADDAVSFFGVKTLKPDRLRAAKLERQFGDIRGSAVNSVDESMFASFHFYQSVKY